MPNITEIRCKQALNRINNPGLPQQWDLNLYRGCQHGCVYCFAIYSHEYLNPNSNYYDDLYVKINIVEQLEKQLRSPNWKRETIAIAGVTDCYQPIEAKYKLMPEILKLMIKYQNPVSISTKSDLILRDYDLIDELSRVADVNITASIVCMDNDIRRKIEPAGRNAKQKFNMLKEFSKTNATTGLLQMPIIPHITDSRENIEDLYAHAKEARVNYVVPGILYLRGKTRGVFFDFIKREFPDLFIPLTKLYQKGGRSEYQKSLYRMINELRRKHGLSSYYAKKSTPQKDELADIKKIADGFEQLSLFETNATSTYEATPIPNRDQLVAKPARQTTPVAKTDLASFVEIEMGSEAPTYQAAAIPRPGDQAPKSIQVHQQPIKEELLGERDEKRTLFYSMRQIARNTNAYTDHSKIFYDQAIFMKDFEDDYAGNATFSSYLPYYQRMSYEQLRTFFTWRTKVRKGDITATTSTYAFLYIYELLNQIGVENPEDGLTRLTTFWQNFRLYDKEVDQHLIQWLKDYHIYYPVSQTFQEFATSHQLIMHYPTVFGYDSNQANSLDLFASISKYDIKKSVFYTEETQKMIHDCFYFILTQLRQLFQKQNACFEDLIFYPLTKEVAWIPFNRALFYPAFKQTNREIMLTEKEIYRHQDGRWLYKSAMLADNGRQLVGYILKEMESCLRRVVKYKYKLKANPDVCDEQALDKLEEMGIVFPTFIEQAVTDFHRQMTHQEVKVDLKNLGRIRQEAYETQEKLIVPEEENVKFDVANFSAIKADMFESRDVDIVEIESADIPTMASLALTSWDELKAALTTVECEALRLVARGQSLKDFAREHLVMLEVLVDGINDKAMDFVGDTLLEIDDDVILYDDYLDDVAKLVNE